MIRTEIEQLMDGFALSGRLSAPGLMLDNNAPLPHLRRREMGSENEVLRTSGFKQAKHQHSLSGEGSKYSRSAILL